MVEISRNTVKEARERREDNTGRRDGDGGGRERRRPGEDNQFQERIGGSPEKISREFTPLMAKEWGEDMRLYAKRCSNLDCLASGEQRTL